MEERFAVDVPLEISDESMADLLAELKKFDFESRAEFWSSQDCGIEALRKIQTALSRGNWLKAEEILTNICTEYYRRVFARGCRAGFDDLAILLNLGPEAPRASVEAWHRMCDAIPKYSKKDQNIKEWRSKYKIYWARKKKAESGTDTN